MNAAQEMRNSLSRENVELEDRARINMDTQRIAFAAMDAYRAAHPKWWKRMDGTPILNDLPVVMASTFAQAIYDSHVRDATMVRTSKYVVPEGPDKALIEDLLRAADAPNLMPKWLQQRLYEAVDRLGKPQPPAQDAGKEAQYGPTPAHITVDRARLQNELQALTQREAAQPSAAGTAQAVALKTLVTDFRQWLRSAHDREWIRLMESLREGEAALAKDEGAK